MANKDENMLTWILAVRTFWLDSSNQGWNFKWNGGVFVAVKVDNRPSQPEVELNNKKQTKGGF